MNRIPVKLGLLALLPALLFATGCGKGRSKTPTAVADAVQPAPPPVKAAEKETPPKTSLFDLMGGMSPFQLVNRKSVQAELQMTGDQLARIKQAQSDESAKRREKRQEAAATKGKKSNQTDLKFLAQSQGALDEAVKQSLTPQQWSRMEQIAMQYRVQHHGVLWLFAKPDIQSKLAFNAEQSAQVSSIKSKEPATIKGLFKKKDEHAVKPTLDKFYKEANDELLGMLTEPQRKQWDSLLGSPFHFDSTEFAVAK